MPGRGKKGTSGSRIGGVRLQGSSKRRSPKPGASELSHLVVQFNKTEDPSIEQTAAIHEVVKKFEKKAYVSRELPGALQIDIHPEAADLLRKEVDGLPDWKVINEGTAHMPDKPLPEDIDDGGKHK